MKPVQLTTCDDIGRIEWSVEATQALRGSATSRAAQLLAVHRMLDNASMLQRVTILEYRCQQRRCLLGRIFESPIGPALYLPTHRYSPERNEGTDVDARAVLTSDGERRWAESAEVLTDFLEPWLNCDHVLDFPLAPGRTIVDAAEHRGEVVLIG